MVATGKCVTFGRIDDIWKMYNVTQHQQTVRDNLEFTM